MKTFSEIRAEAWKELREGKWIWKFIAVAFVLSMATGVISGLWDFAVKAMGIQTWSTFLIAKAKALASTGLDLTVPNRETAIRMWEATAFETFIQCIIYGIVTFAMAGFFLRAAKGEREAWFGAAFGGFKYPLGVAWLYFRQILQIALWSMLFVIPGVVAIYRYCQCWNLKVEHPDWSAGRCLAESARMMKGQKWNRFSLDCSYWKPITLLMMGVLALTILVAFGFDDIVVKDMGAAFGIAMLATYFACMWGAIVLGAYMSIGQAKFYLGLKDASPAEPSGTAPAEPSSVVPAVKTAGASSAPSSNTTVG